MANPAWKRGGASPNPLGPFAQRTFAEAVRMACAADDPVKRIRKLRLIAEQLVDQAVAGDLTAIGMVADRLDGKPISESHVTSHRGMLEMSDEELLSIVASAKIIEHDPG